MVRNFKECPKCIFSIRQAMRKFTDCLNKAGIFNEKIPYLVIHQGKRYYSSRLELKLTFKEGVKTICTSKDTNRINKQLTDYIVKKLNNVPNFDFDLSSKVFIKMLDKTDEEMYKSHLVAYLFEIFNELHNENMPITNKCTLIVSIYNKNIPLFEIYGE